MLTFFHLCVHNPRNNDLKHLCYVSTLLTVRPGMRTK